MRGVLCVCLCAHKVGNGGTGHQSSCRRLSALLNGVLSLSLSLNGTFPKLQTSTILNVVVVAVAGESLSVFCGTCQRASQTTFCRAETMPTTIKAMHS